MIKSSNSRTFLMSNWSNKSVYEMHLLRMAIVTMVKCFNFFFIASVSSMSVLLLSKYCLYVPNANKFSVFR